MRFLRKPYIAISIFLLLFAAGFYLYLIKDLPSVGTLEEYSPNLVTKVYSSDGSVIAEFFRERRIVASMGKIPPHLIKAFLAAEDTKFFEHGGIDYLGITRAIYKNITAGRIVQGASTITQQVARTFFLTPERKITRKIREAILAYRIEKHLSKEDILYLYLNQIYFGNGAYGVETAAQTYFGKDVEELDIAESALLAALPKAPTTYSPYTNFDLAKKRQEFVITRMLEEGYITKEEAEKSIRKKLILKPSRKETLWAGPFFTEHVRRYAEEKYGEDLLYKGGLEIYTTMNVTFQRAANSAVEFGLRAYDKRRGFRGPQVALRSNDGIASFLDSVEEELSHNPIREGRIYRAVVASVNKAERTMDVSIGRRMGIISYPDFQWARLYNQTGEADGGKFVDPLKIFQNGDVIDVRVKALPDDEKTSKIRLSLEQEPLVEGSLICMDPKTGYVVAMVGGLDFSKTQYNRAIQAKRQPGSAFKPIIYTAAIDRGYTPATIVIDSPIVFEEKESGGEKRDWRPKNFEDKFIGPTTIRNAITKSRNVITIKVLKDIGVGGAISYAKRLGIESPLAPDLSLALGSSSVSLLELTRAFATFANMGQRPAPLFITKITDKYGNVLEENTPEMEEAISPQTAYIMTSLLESVIEDGTGWRAKALGRAVAGKTGTTNNTNDAWFLGYTPSLAAGAWVGYDGEQPLGRNETGAVAALPIWLKFMEEATKGVAPENFPVPDGIEFARIDPSTGLLAEETTKDAVFEVFKSGTSPRISSAGRKNTREGKDFFLMDSGEEPDKKEEPKERARKTGSFPF